MSIDDIIDAVIKREGGFSNDRADAGGRTQFGIAESTHPQAWRNGPPTLEQARAIYRDQYVKGPGLDKLPQGPLQTQMVDYAVNSGPQTAIMALQVALGLRADGVLGPATLGLTMAADQTHLNNLVVAERVKKLGRIVVANPTQLAFLNGWLERALSFIS